jgi:hypothetical protein
MSSSFSARKEKMRMSDDIYRKRVCDICGDVVYEPYIGTDAFDGGYTTVNKFEPSGYTALFLGDKHWTVCPKCAKIIGSNIRLLTESVKHVEKMIFSERGAEDA